jgi:hypothetical protein
MTVGVRVIVTGTPYHAVSSRWSHGSTLTWKGEGHGDHWKKESSNRYPLTPRTHLAQHEFLFSCPQWNFKVLKFLSWFSPKEYNFTFPRDQWTSNVNSRNYLFTTARSVGSRRCAAKIRFCHEYLWRHLSTQLHTFSDVQITLPLETILRLITCVHRVYLKRLYKHSEASNR